MRIKEWNKLVASIFEFAKEEKTSRCGGSWSCYRCGSGCECDWDERTPVWEFTEQELIELVEFTRDKIEKPLTN